MAMVDGQDANTTGTTTEVADLHVAVTTSNPEKHRAVRDAFCKQFPETTVVVHACPSESGIPHGQPWGLQHTYEGALARLHNLKACSDGQRRYDYMVSVENGVTGLLTHTETIGLDVACVVVESVASGQQSMNMSQARPYPLGEVQSMKKAGASNGDIGRWCKEWYDKQNFPLTRYSQIYSACSFALVVLNPTGAMS
eukprot:TRINITY_DN73367_c0_g1_i1.p1 TRINITY_DN73367_c0_g1~~TRINITY_DN73367_c0_g1_i1.p1  ORF type:complete len:197 (-),score=21.31 TRINITY_DN73367_c0_g1_i1:164-754(-)